MGRVSLVPAIKVPVRLILTLIPPLLALASVPLNKLLFKRWKWGQSFWTRELKARWGRGSQGQRMCVKRMKSNQTVQRGGQQLFLSHKEGRPSLDLTSPEESVPRRLSNPENRTPSWHYLLKKSYLLEGEKIYNPAIIQHQTTS